MGTCKYQLSQRVVLVESQEVGTIMARAEYVRSIPSYLIRYKNKEGSLREEWWDESALATEVI